MALGHGSLSDNGQGEGMPTPGGGGLFANKKTDPLTSSRSEAFRTVSRQRKEQVTAMTSPPKI